MNRLASLLLALLLLALPRVSAAEETGSISVRMTHGGQAVPGGSITLYRVAAPGDDWQYVPAPEFADCSTDLNGVLSPADAERLSGHAAGNGIPGQTLELGADGLAVFSPLEPGLYLLVQRESGSGFLPVKPFLVGVPQQLGGALCYQVDASPKCAPEPDAPGSPGLPQTGQLRWPVPLMTALGLFFLAGGLLLYRKEPHA